MQSSFSVAYIAASVYVVEIIGPSKRHYGQITSIGFGIGYMLRKRNHERIEFKKIIASFIFGIHI